MTLTRYLSKSQYTRGLQCAKSLWLYREKKELQDPTSPEQQAIFDQGTEVGILAQKWIGGGVLIKAGHADPAAALEETAAALAAGARVLYEAAYLYDDVLVRVDIMMQGPGGGWDLYEVKSTTAVEKNHLDDVAIQRYVLTGAGVRVNRAHLVHLDPGYVRQGALDLQRLFLPVDVTHETEPLLDVIAEQVRGMKEVAVATEPPKVAIGPRCTKPYDCSFTGHCWAHVPDYSVFNLSGARMDKKTELWNGGYKTIDQIPDFDKRDPETKLFKLTEFQQVQREVAKSGKPAIHPVLIAEHLRTLHYPAYFLDFEAVNPAIPPYDGLRPYQQLPFEASLHVRQERGGPLEHHEYLADGTRDPRGGLVEFLRQRIGPIGSVVAFSKSYEGNLLKAMAAWTNIGNAAVELNDFEQRLWDVAEPFRKGFYAHPGFKGRWSIKAVLPVLCPDLTYDGLAIKNGAEAMTAYARLMDIAAGKPGNWRSFEEERDAIMAALRAYCGQDTLAMVRLLDILEDVAAAKEAAR